MPESGNRVLAADAGLLVAAKRHLDRRQIVAVDPAGAGLRAARSRGARARNLAVKTPADRPNSVSLARAIGLFLVVEGKHAHHRTENLLPHDRHVVGDSRRRTSARRKSRLQSLAMTECRRRRRASPLSAADRDIGRAPCHAAPGRSAAPSASPGRADRRCGSPCAGDEAVEEARPAMPRCTKTRVPLEQISSCRVEIARGWPPQTAFSRSASSKTISGDFPPSSIVTCFSCRPAAAMTRLPVGTEPVSETLRRPDGSQAPRRHRRSLGPH